MRAARLVAVHWVFDGVAVTREHADLKTSSWQVGQDGDKKHMMWPQTVHLGLDPRPDELGSAVLLLLQEPSIRTKVTASVQDHT